MYTHHAQDLDLGVRTDGTRVNNVFIPPWAKGWWLWLATGNVFHIYYLYYCVQTRRILLNGAGRHLSVTMSQSISISGSTSSLATSNKGRRLSKLTTVRDDHMTVM